MQQYEFFVEENKINDELKPWQALENVIRSWAALTGHEKSLENYENLKKHTDDVVKKQQKD
jgi:hypothetical protein